MQYKVGRSLLLIVFMIIMAVPVSAQEDFSIVPINDSEICGSSDNNFRATPGPDGLIAFWHSEDLVNDPFLVIGDMKTGNITRIVDFSTLTLVNGVLSVFPGELTYSVAWVSKEQLAVSAVVLHRVGSLNLYQNESWVILVDLENNSIKLLTRGFGDLSLNDQSELLLTRIKNYRRYIWSFNLRTNEEKLRGVGIEPSWENDSILVTNIIDNSTTDIELVNPYMVVVPAERTVVEDGRGGTKMINESWVGDQDLNTENEQLIYRRAYMKDGVYSSHIWVNDLDQSTSGFQLTEGFGVVDLNPRWLNKKNPAVILFDSQRDQSGQSDPDAQRNIWSFVFPGIFQQLTCSE